MTKRRINELSMLACVVKDLNYLFDEIIDDIKKNDGHINFEEELGFADDCLGEEMIIDYILTALDDFLCGEGGYDYDEYGGLEEYDIRISTYENRRTLKVTRI